LPPNGVISVEAELLVRIAGSDAERGAGTHAQGGGMVPTCPSPGAASRRRRRLLSGLASALPCSRRLYRAREPLSGPSGWSPHSAAPFTEAPGARAPGRASVSARLGLLAARLHALATGRTPSRRYAESQGARRRDFTHGRSANQPRLHQQLAAQGRPRRRPALRATGGAANIVRGPTSSHRFTAQSGPVVLSYGLTVMTS
jgi:hypothetical protein